MAQTHILNADYFIDRDRVLASDLVDDLSDDFEIGVFGTRSLLQFPAARIKRLFKEQGIDVETTASIVTLYRLGGLDLFQIQTALSDQFLRHYPQMQIATVHIRPQSFVDVEGLELIEVQLGANQLRRNKGTFQAWYGQDGQGLRRLFFAYEIEAALEVLEATRVIDSGTLLDSHNTRRTLQAFENLSADPVRVDQLSAIIAKGRIRQGDVITQNRVSIVPDVRRGSRIRVELSENGVRLTFLATAKRDAMIGEWLEVEDERGRSFQVRVLSQDLAKVE